MTLIQMNAQQMRAKAIKNMEERRQREKQFEEKVHSMSAHDVGSYYDIRAIKNSKQFKEQKVYFDTEKVNAEFEDMMTHNRLIKETKLFRPFKIIRSFYYRCSFNEIMDKNCR